MEKDSTESLDPAIRQTRTIVELRFELIRK